MAISAPTTRRCSTSSRQGGPSVAIIERRGSWSASRPDVDGSAFAMFSAADSGWQPGSSPEQPLQPAARGALRRWTLGRLARVRLRTAQDPSRALGIALRFLLELVDVDLGGQRPAAALTLAEILPLAALIVRQCPVVIWEDELGDQLIRGTSGEAVVIRGVVGLHVDEELPLLVVDHRVASQQRMVRVLDRYAVLVVLEHRVVDRGAVCRLAAPPDALDVLVHRVADHEAIRGPRREVDAAVLVPKQRVSVGGDVGRIAVHADALPASVGRVVDRDAIARAVERDAAIGHVTEGEAHHGDVVLPRHAAATVAVPALHLVRARRLAVARAHVEHLGVRIVVEPG